MKLSDYVVWILSCLILLYTFCWMIENSSMDRDLENYEKTHRTSKWSVS